MSSALTADAGTILPFQNNSSNGSSRQETVIAGIEAGAVRKVADLFMTLSAAERRHFLDYIVRPCNFFKDANRDPVATLEEDNIDPDGMIGHAMTMISTGKPMPDTIKHYLKRHDPLGTAQS